MATVTEMNREALDRKLDLLKEQRDLLNQALHYINKVLDEGRACTDGENQNQATISEVSKMIYGAVDFLNLKYREMKDLSDTMIQLKPVMSLEAPLDLAEETKSSHLPSAVSETTSSVSATSVLTRVHCAADESLLPVLTRCDLIEQSIDSLQTSTEKLKDAQVDITKQFEHISTKQFDVDRIISDIACNQTKLENTQISNLSEGNKMNKLIDDQTHGMKQQQLKIENLEKKLEQLSSRMNELEQLNTSRMETNDEIKGDVGVINVQIEMIKSHVDSLSSTMEDTSLTVWKLSDKTEAVEELARDLSQKVSSNKQTLQLISRNQEQHSETVKKLEDLSLETVNRKDMEVMEKQVKEIHDNYKMLCMILYKRLQPLEQLRDCLNKKLQTRDENVKKLLDVMTDVEELTLRVRNLEFDQTKSEYAIEDPHSVLADDRQAFYKAQ